MFFVAALIVVASGMPLAGLREPRPSVIGMLLLVGAGFGMPWLAKQKRALANQVGSAALKANAAESAISGYLSWIALAGLLSNALFGKSWADPLVALVLTPFIPKEGWKAIRESGCGCS